MPISARLCAVLVASALCVAAAPPDPVGATGPARSAGVVAVPPPTAPTPPMGWNPWYRFGCNVTEQLITQTADAIVKSGMRALGYRYVNIDDCWMARERDVSGSLVADPAKFPHGIAAVAAYVHARGLKLGIYIDAGSATCAGYPGSAGAYARDAETLAGWGVDSVKVDWCHTPALPAQLVYDQVRTALDASGRQMLLQVCDWGIDAPWTWAPTIAYTWRTAGDYNWYGAPASYWRAVRTVADINGRLSRYAHPSAWNDPDLLLAGTGFLNQREQRSQLNLWSMMAAPLLVGADIRSMSRQIMALLTNRQLIAIDQDRAGAQGTPVVKRGAREVWVRRLASGARALLLLNAGAARVAMSAGLSHLGLPRARRYVVHDVWTGRTRIISGRVGVRLAAHDSALFLIRVKR